MGRRPKKPGQSTTSRGKRRAAPKRRRPARAAGRNAATAALKRELSDALRQQAATAEVLQIISSSPGDLQQAFAKMLDHAARICDAKYGNVFRLEGDTLHLVASHNTPAALIEARRRVKLNPKLPFGRMVATKAAVHVADIKAEEGYTVQRDPRLVMPVEIGGARTVLVVPMLKDGEVIGAFSLYRQEVRPFADRQIALLTSFAAQAVVAAENTRLLNTLRQRTEELGRSIAELQRERSNKLMNLEAMAASIGHEVRQPLASIASNGSAARRFLSHTPPNLAEARLALERMINDAHRASQVFDNIRALFGKTDRSYAPIDMSALIRGVLKALAEELKEHGIATETALSAALPPVLGHRGQLQEVFVNLIRNAIEAMDGSTAGRRTLRLRTERETDESIIVAVEDSGPGIDPGRADDIFDAFITTKPNGMGLGLAICRMIVQRHEGRLSAAPAVPTGSIFRVALPAARV